MKKLFESNINTDKKEIVFWSLIYPSIIILGLIILVFLILYFSVYSFIGFLLLFISLLVVHVTVYSRIQSEIIIYNDKIEIVYPRFFLLWKKKRKEIPINNIKFYNKEDNMIEFFINDVYRHQFYIQNPNNDKRRIINNIESTIIKLGIDDME